MEAGLYERLKELQAEMRGEGEGEGGMRGGGGGRGRMLGSKCHVTANTTCGKKKIKVDAVVGRHEGDYKTLAVRGKGGEGTGKGVVAT